MTPFRVLFDNENFVAVDKCAGVLTVPSRFAQDDSRPCLGRLLETDLACRLWPVHRLDFEVSGLVLFAKNAEAHRFANRAFEERQVQKTYQALSENPQGLDFRDGERFEWRSKLLRGKKRSYAHERGQIAITRARFEGRDRQGHFRWILEPHTGRAHQLRVHLSAAACPIWGDLLYGAQERFEPNGIALKAVALDFAEADGHGRLGLPTRLSAPPLF